MTPKETAIKNLFKQRLVQLNENTSDFTNQLNQIRELDKQMAAVHPFRHPENSKEFDVLVQQKSVPDQFISNAIKPTVVKLGKQGRYLDAKKFVGSVYQEMTTPEKVLLFRYIVFHESGGNKTNLREQTVPVDLKAHNQKVNALLNAVREYNHRGRKSGNDLLTRITRLAADLGLVVGKHGSNQVVIKRDNGKKVGRPRGTVKFNAKPLEVRRDEFQQFYHVIAPTIVGNAGVNDMKVDVGLSQKQINKAVADIEAGTFNQYTDILLNGMEQMYNEGTVGFIQGSGNNRNREGIPVEVIFQYKNTLSEVFMNMEKKYGQEYPLTNLQPNTKVHYNGVEYDVMGSDGDGVVTLKDKNGREIKVNQAMFNQAGAISKQSTPAPASPAQPEPPAQTAPQPSATSQPTGQETRQTRQPSPLDEHIITRKELAELADRIKANRAPMPEWFNPFTI